MMDWIRQKQKTKKDKQIIKKQEKKQQTKHKNPKKTTQGSFMPRLM